MNKRPNPYNKLSLEDLEELIQCYFDCSLSEDDELALRKVVAATSFDSPAVREAKAVMGYMAAGTSAVSPAKHRGAGVRAWLKITASVAASLILLVGVRAVTSYQSEDDDVCVAYVNGERINNKDVVMQLMKLDLLTMNNGHETVNDGITDDFAAIRDAIN